MKAERERRFPFDAVPTRRNAALAFALSTPFVVLFFFYRYLGAVMDGRSVSALETLVNETTGVWLATLLFLAIIALARTFPMDRPGRLRRVPVHLAGVVAFASAHTSLMWGSRSVIYPLVGLGDFSFGPMPLRYVMEFPQQFVIYTTVVLLTHLYDRNRAERVRELRVSRLETELAQARLEMLRMQLNPHFLFNTLNTISSVMYEDVRAADAMLTRLSDLLRRTLTGSDAPEVPLASELDLLNIYADIMRWRFQDRLAVHLDVDAEAGAALVPSMVLQPLIENAIEHGGADGRPLRLEVSARRSGPRLLLQVRDWGRGAPVPGGEFVGWGIGLTNTAERLRTLYGDDHGFEIESLAPDGFLVALDLPYRTAERATASPPVAAGGGA